MVLMFVCPALSPVRVGDAVILLVAGWLARHSMGGGGLVTIG